MIKKILITIIMFLILFAGSCGGEDDRSNADRANMEACKGYALSIGSQDWEFEAPRTCYLRAHQPDRYAVDTLDIMTGEMPKIEYQQTVDMWTQTAPGVMP